LIEVVVALLLAVGSLAALLPVFSDSGVRAERAALSRLALLPAQSALAVASAGPMTPGWSLSGRGPGLVWRAEVTAADDATPPLRHLAVVVWAAGPEGPVGEPLARLQTLRIPPGGRDGEG
jgi:type II secretory pathway pseudopilin PulG